MSTNQPTKVITGKCRLSYSHVWDAVSIDGNSDPKFGACIIIPKNDKVTIKKVNAAIQAAIMEGVKSKWKGKKRSISSCRCVTVTRSARTMRRSQAATS